LPTTKANYELRFFITSTVKHESILSEDEMRRILNALKYHNKTIYKKLWPFYCQCLEDYQKWLKENEK